MPCQRLIKARDKSTTRSETYQNRSKYAVRFSTAGKCQNYFFNETKKTKSSKNLRWDSVYKVIFDFN